MSQEDRKKLPELVKEKAARVKQHMMENKTTYMVGASCLVGGTAVVLYFRRPIVIDFQPVINNAPNIAPVFNNHVENNLGRVSKIVRDVETGQEWQKLRYLAEEAAKKYGISYDSARVRLSNHLSGKTDNFFGRVYEIVGLRTDF